MAIKEVFAYLSVNDAAGAIEFYKQAFGATEKYRLVEPGSSRVGHAELDFGGSTVMLADEYPELNFRGPDKLGGTPLAFIHKTRDPLRPNEVVANRVVGEVEGRACVLVDDMIDTGGTIVKAAETLFEAGAADVIVAATHGVLSGPAMDRLKNSNIFDSADNVNTTYTVDVSGEAADGAWKLQVRDVYSGDTGSIDTWTLTL